MLKVTTGGLKVNTCYILISCAGTMYFRSQEQTCSSVARDYEGKYADVVDSLDEQSGN